LVELMTQAKAQGVVEAPGKRKARSQDEGAGGM
jgi:hypothetical protein